MNKSPVIYVLEYGMTQRGGELSWSPLVNKECQPITFGGSSGKVRAITFCKELARHPVHDGLRVLRGADVVWNWKRS